MLSLLRVSRDTRSSGNYVYIYTFQTVLNISEDRAKWMCEITKECSFLLGSFTPVDDLQTTYIYVYVHMYIYKPSRCNRSVTYMAWISRALNTIIGRAKTQIKGKFLLAVATLSFTRLGDHQAAIYIYIYI